MPPSTGGFTPRVLFTPLLSFWSLMLVEVLVAQVLVEVVLSLPLPPLLLLPLLLLLPSLLLLLALTPTWRVKSR